MRCQVVSLAVVVLVVLGGGWTCLAKKVAAGRGLSGQ